MHLSVTELDGPDLTCQLENWIEQRTSGRVRDVSVEIIGRRVVVHGHAGSYYVRQLALAAVLEVLQPERVEQVELDIDVGSTLKVAAGFPARALRGHAPGLFPVPGSQAI